MKIYKCALFSESLEKGFNTWMKQHYQKVWKVSVRSLTCLEYILNDDRTIAAKITATPSKCQTKSFQEQFYVG